MAIWFGKNQDPMIGQSIERPIMGSYVLMGKTNPRENNTLVFWLEYDTLVLGYPPHRPGRPPLSRKESPSPLP